MNDTNRKLLSIVLDKTNKKLLIWSRGSSNNEFKVELNSATLPTLKSPLTYTFPSFKYKLEFPNSILEPFGTVISPLI